jgi:hypothetical protein
MVEGVARIDLDRVAMTVTFAVSCGPLQCAFDFEERTVQRRGGRV